jgi:hypothetical protein
MDARSLTRVMATVRYLAAARWVVLDPSGSLAASGRG